MGIRNAKVSWPILVALVLAVCFAWQGRALAQQSVTGSAAQAARRFPSGSGSWSVGLAPVVKMGIERMGFKLSLGVPAAEQGQSPYSSLLDTFPLDLHLRDTTFWAAGFGVEVSSGQTMGGSFTVLGSLPRDVVFSSDQSPAIGTINTLGNSYPGTITGWRGFDTEWWQIDLNAAYRISPGFEVVLGWKFDEIWSTVSDPTPPPSTTVIPLVAGLRAKIDLLTGDLRVRTNVPYVGLHYSRSSGSKSEVSLIAGPAFIRVDFPLYLQHQGIYRFFIVDFEQLAETANYKFNNPGFFVKGAFEYGRTIAPGFDISFWAEGSWLRSIGSGAVNLEGSNAIKILSVIPLTTETFSGSSAGDSSFTMHSYAGGIKAEIVF